MNNRITDQDDEKVVFFFGAGASKSEGEITTNQLLEKSFKRFPSDDKVIMVKEYLKDIYNNKCDNSNIPTLEEVLGPIDIALQKQENMSTNWDVEKLTDLRDNLIYCICKILDENLQSPKGYHKKFVDNLLVMYPDLWKKCSFISLNYDILLDNELTKLVDSASNIDLNYGIQFRNNDWRNPREQNVRLLKLHGSLNWLYCPTCNSIKITPKEKGVMKIYTQSENCESDFCKGRSKQKPIVVPPTFTKAYGNPFLVSIWLQAEIVLQKATTVCFIGYSMPEADIHIQYLLKKSLFRQDGNKPKIIVVNPDPKNKTTHKRYQRLFGEVKYLQIGFEEFALQPDKYLHGSQKETEIEQAAESGRARKNFDSRIAESAITKKLVNTNYGGK